MLELLQGTIRDPRQASWYTTTDKHLLDCDERVALLKHQVRVLALYSGAATNFLVIVYHLVHSQANIPTKLLYLSRSPQLPAHVSSSTA